MMNDKEKEAFLHDLYYNKHRAQGRDSLFYYISKILRNTDISRRYIAEWLAKQTTQQLFTQRKPVTNIRPIITNRPGAILQADLIDFSKSPSNGFRYILNVIDCFSRKVWLNEIKSKTIQAVLPAMNNIVQDIQKDYVINVIHSDAGGEFNIRYPKIKALQSRGYTAQSQGLVERSNGTVKSILYKLMYENKTKEWQPFLNDVEEVYNSTYNRNLGMTPDEAYRLDKESQVEQHQQQKANHAKSYKEINTILRVGDHVRIVEPKLKIKSKGQPNWSTEIYSVSKVIKGSKKNQTINRYKLIDKDDIVQKNTYPISKLLVIPEGE